uniref:Peptidase S1 domain-containing protein n=1 Tax=Graphocephala atropunctata TaxID=36148 RepID=A0A1B6LIP5_9HEMI
MLRTIMLTLFITFAIVTAACADKGSLLRGPRPNVGDRKRLGIFDGNKTNIAKYPYLVSMVYEETVFNCPGVIVSEKWVVTTGTCGAIMGHDYQVIAGSQDSFHGQMYTVENVVIHPNATWFDYCYACIQIRGKFKWSKKVQPVKLPRSLPKVNTKMTVLGWGGDPTGFGGTQELETEGPQDPLSQVLRQGMMRWISMEECKKIYAPPTYNISWNDRMACAYNKGKVTICDGDGGDPFVHNGVLYGAYLTMAMDDFCTEDALPAILANFVPGTSWIREVTGAKYADE